MNFKFLVEQCNNIEVCNLDHRPVWIFGTGTFGCALAKILLEEGFDLQGFTETNPTTDSIMGLSVKPLVDVPNTEQLAIGIFNRGVSFSTLKKQASDLGFTDIYMPWNLYTQFQKKLGWRYWLSHPDVIIKNLDRIQTVYDLLADERSKQCLIDICLFRLGKKISYAEDVDTDAQYFNHLTLDNLSKEIVYLDGGAYDGDTYLDLSNRLTVKHAYLFEPDPANFSKLIKNVENHSLTCMPMALTDSYKILTFNADGSEGSSVSDNGKMHIAAVALDELLHKQSVDFIKLDVEGSEISAIKGAYNTIKQNRPVLTISLYHKPDDLWEIPLELLSVCTDYKFYIRQHYYNSFDCVLYGIPT